MTLDEFEEATTRLLAAAGLRGAVTVRRRVLAGLERLELERKVGATTRYLQVHAVEEPAVPWEFVALGGSHGSPDPGANFDGRRGGGARYMLTVVAHWLVDLAEWGELPFFHTPR